MLSDFDFNLNVLNFLNFLTNKLAHKFLSYVTEKNAGSNGTLNKKFDRRLILNENRGACKDFNSPNENSTDALNRANIGHLSLGQRASFDGPINHSLSTQSLPRISTGNGIRGIQRNFLQSRTSSLTRDGSLDGCMLNRTAVRKQFEEEDEATTPTDDRVTSPPPKPNRSMQSLKNDSTLTLKDLPLDGGPQFNRVVSYHASGSDSGNGSGDSAQSSAANDSLADGQQQPQRIGGVIIRNPKFLPSSASSTTLKSYAECDYADIENNLMGLEIPELEQFTKFDLENFTTLLLPAIENKPLDNDALNNVRIMLSETAPRVIANHISRIDFKLLLDPPGKTANNEESIFNCSGIELITLNHGAQFRKDLIERAECIRLLVAVTILTCSDDSERAETLNKWIQIAIDTKTALGNLYGFSNIMLGLCMPQVGSLFSNNLISMENN